MEWVLFVSLQWIVNGTPLPPTVSPIVVFPSEEKCKSAASTIRAEIAAAIPNVQTYGRVVCFMRKER